MRPARHWHRWAGLVLLAPLAVWIATGAVFLVRPGYEVAYAELAVKRYALGDAPARESAGPWHEVRRLRTILGPHLLVRDGAGTWRQLDPATGAPRPRPDPGALRRLVADAIGEAPRYGRIARVEGNMVHTTTGVRITLDWPRLALEQRGRDTRWIAWAYDVHSMEWTGVAWLDKALGGVALLALAAVSGLGAWLFARPVG
jgi:hypothetical protein